MFRLLPIRQPAFEMSPRPNAPHHRGPNRRRLLLACAAALAGGPAWAQTPAAPALQLLTEAEAQREAAQAGAGVPAEGPRSRSLRPQSPQIRVIAPLVGVDAAVPAPLRLEVGFQAAPGARIVPASFRLLYGVLRIDLTERLRAQASISESGVLLERALMPPGTHRLWVQVGDDQGNLAEQELRFRIAGGP
jgi:hypothetical protein